MLLLVTAVEIIVLLPVVQIVLVDVQAGVQEHAKMVVQTVVKADV